MKKQKTKKKLSRTRTRAAELDPTPKFMDEPSKEPAGLDALDLAPQAPLGAHAHREYTEVHRD